jgi:hypothetical protein
VGFLDAEAIGLAVQGWQHETPLWLYVLREAEVLCDGERLGPVGGRIVGEVLVGIIDHDRDSFRALEADWQPYLAVDGSFSLADVLLPGQYTSQARTSEPARGRPHQTRTTSPTTSASS